MNPAAQCRKEKEAHPDRYCPKPGCLWRLRTASSVVTPCRKHDREAYDRVIAERVAAAKAYKESMKGFRESIGLKP